MMDRLRVIWADVLGLEPGEVEDDASFFELGGDSVKAIRLLGEAASFSTNVDLETLYRCSSLAEFYRCTCDCRNDQNSHSSHGKATGSGTGTIAPGINTSHLKSALDKLRIPRDKIVKAAMMTPMQESMIQLTLAGNFGLLNSIYEVEGVGLESGLERVAELLDTKNPILRTTVVQTTTGFAQVLLAETLSTFVHAASVKEYLSGTQKAEVPYGAGPVQYCLVLNDADHAGKNFFVITINHIFCDGFSRFLLEKDLMQILRSPSAYAAENERPWFGDLVTHLKASRTEDQVDQFWTTYLEGANMENIHTGSPGKFTCSADWDDVVTQVVPASTLSHSSQTAVILAAWSIALSRRSGLRDIVFALCRHGRSGAYEDAMCMVGPLMTITPFRLRLENREEPTNELLRRVQDEVLLGSRWEQGRIPNVFDSGDGRPWPQSILNLKPDLSAMQGHYEMSGDGSGDISLLVPRSDLQEYFMDSDWTIYILISRKHQDFSFTMYYNPTLIDRGEAESLLRDFTRLVGKLGPGPLRAANVGDLLGYPIGARPLGKVDSGVICNDTVHSFL